jgi:hypothetical protein
MAHIDYIEAARYKAQMDAFSRLMEHLKGGNIELTDEEKRNARNQIMDMSETMKKQEEQIKKFYEFFDMLYHFLPKPMTIHDKIY